MKIADADVSFASSIVPILQLLPAKTNKQKQKQKKQKN